jgi:FtsZ-interacting cell division protein ZipA
MVFRCAGLFLPGRFAHDPMSEFGTLMQICLFLAQPKKEVRSEATDWFLLMAGIQWVAIS